MAPGFAVVDNLDMDWVSNETAKAMLWVLGECIGCHVAKRWNSSMLFMTYVTPARLLDMACEGHIRRWDWFFTRTTFQACRFLMCSALCVYTQPRKAISVGFVVFIAYITVY